MEQLEKRISYLRGLADGLEVREASKEGKILAEAIQIMDDLYASQQQLFLRLDAMEEYVEAIDEDLNDLEIFSYGEDEWLLEEDEDNDDEIVDIYYELDDDESVPDYPKM